MADLDARGVDTGSIASGGHYASGQRHTGRRVERACERLDIARLASAVVVEEDEDITLGLAGGEVHGAAVAQVLREADHPHGLRVGLRHRRFWDGVRDPRALEQSAWAPQRFEQPRQARPATR